MTTFERFKRDIKCRSGSEGKNSMENSLERKDSKVNTLLSFSANVISFTIEEGRCSVFKLRMTNLTGFKIHFKIRCNNSKCYSVVPFQEVVSDKQSIDIKFQLRPIGNDLSLNLNDKFQIKWGKIPYQPNEPTLLTEFKVFPVQIQHKDLTQFQQSGFNTQLRTKNQRFEEVQEPFSSRKQVPQVQANTLLTKQNLILVSVISFVLGFIFT